MTARGRLSAFVLAFLCVTNSGCVALLDAAFREADDHGHHARYENKSYGEHYLDAVFEADDDDDCCDDDDGCHHVTVVTVHEG